MCWSWSVNDDGASVNFVRTVTARRRTGRAPQQPARTTLSPRAVPFYFFFFFCYFSFSTGGIIRGRPSLHAPRTESARRAAPRTRNVSGRRVAEPLSVSRAPHWSGGRLLFFPSRSRSFTHTLSISLSLSLFLFLVLCVCKVCCTVISYHAAHVWYRCVR